MSSLEKSDVWLTVAAPPLVSLAQKWLKTAGFVAGISALTIFPTRARRGHRVVLQRRSNDRHTSSLQGKEVGVSHLETLGDIRSE